MAEDNTEYKKLPVDERCVHKLWKARVDGYEEAAKIFRTIDDDKSPEWSKFVGLIKKMIVDSNAMAQERGLEAALIFVENCGHAGKTVGEVMTGIVQKCIAAPRTRTKELAVQVTLMYVEIERQDAVVDELVKGMEHKNPKIVAACVAATTLALHDFGNKVVGVKPMIKKLAPLMSDRDKAVRDEGKLLAVEIYRWIGAAMKAQIASLPQVTIKELEDEFDKLKGEKAEPVRYIKSQQERQQQMSAAAAETEAGAADEDCEAGGEDIDPMDLLDPVDILGKLPKDFYEKLEEKKWTLRKEALDVLEKLLTDHPKLESGEYGSVVNALRKVVAKDSNVVLVALGGKCLAMLAKGLGKRFSPYAMACIPWLLEKFKEKKTNVVTALRDAMDAIYPSTSLEAMQESIVESLANKNPSVKAETASFLTRAFARTQPTALNKKLLKLLVTTLIKTLNEPDPTVRDCSAEALGTLAKLTGDKAVAPFLVEVDALKLAKIKECQEKAEIKVKILGAKKERPATAPTAKQSAAASAASSRSGSSEPKAVARPATAGAKKVIGGKKPGGGGGGAAPLSKCASTKMMATEREMSPDEVQSKADELLPPDILAGLVDGNWKNRLAAVENLQAQIGEFDAKMAGLSQLLVRTVSGRKPGLKEMNFQVLKIKLDIIRIVAESYPLTTITVDLVVNEITEKLADPKNGTTAADVLTAFAEATKLDYVVGKVLTFSFEQKSPKVQSEALNWVAKSILEFGFQLQPKLLIEDVRKAVQSTNPMVRGAAIALVGTMSLYMGDALMMFFENEKPALKSQIQVEFDKNVGEKPPRPVRGAKRAAGGEDADDAITAGVGGGVDDEPHEQVQMNLTDLLPRIDIAPQITEALLKEMSDKDWKTRNEGLNKLQLLISEARLIKPSIGDLAPALALRLVDPNAKIGQTAMAICEQLANAMGPGCKSMVRTLFPGFLHALGDNKTFVRAAAMQCINSFGEQGGYKEFFESEMIADALKSGSPTLKVELWAWLAERLPGLPPKSVPKDELTSMVPHLYAHICDRNADVRKNANEAVLGIMIHLGYEPMVKALDKQKPASKKDIQAALDKARPNLPVKPLPKGKQQAPITDDTRKVVRGGGGANAGAGHHKMAAASKGGASSANEKGGGGAAGSSRKKDDDVDTSPLLAVNNTKNQRLIDEQKMRVLKWTFTQPREEFTDLLREQMTTANVNKGLMANMFHDDFRYHLKVIESLNEDLPLNSKALVCNLDLILKWLSLRFYDTNPSVLIKGLEYLNAVFQTLVDMEYILAENEGSAFIPHLLLKLGDPKDTVRHGVRSLLRQILLVFPYTKVFVYVMDGLKSKNARQRTECLDELGYLIENYGLTVCQPSQQVALKEVARHISDRDNSVRNAALNCVVQAYFLAGDKVYKLIGQLSEKDLSMLDERIKRAKKTKRPEPTPPVAVSSSIPSAKSATSPQIVHQDSIEIEEPTAALNGSSDELPAPDELSPSSQFSNDANSSTEDMRATSLIRQATFDQPPSAIQLVQLHTQHHKPSGPFGLDPNVIADIESDWVRSDQLEVRDRPRVDIAVLSEPINIIPSRDGAQYPQERFDQLLARSRIMQSHTTPPHSNMAAGMYGGGPNSPYMSSPQQSQNYPLQQQSPHVSGMLHHNSSANNSPNLANVLPKHDPHLIKIIKAISSTDTIKARAAINELTEIIESSEKQAVLRDYEDIFVQMALVQLKNQSQVPIADSLVVYQPLLSILYSFFHSKTLGRTLNIVAIKNLMAALLNLMADQKMNGGEDGQYNKVVNGICLKVLDKANFTYLNCALIRLLRETCPGAGLPKFTDLLMKCIWRNVKMLPERSKELNYDVVIMEVHEFMSALPSAWWQTRPSDTPLRTVKTIIHNMAKVKGNAIMQHVTHIPAHSELHAYLIKILKNLQRDGNLPPGGGGSPQRPGKDVGRENAKRLANQTHETMSHIFKLLSDKDTKQQGLYKLYEFKTQHSDIDLSPFLKGASASFQKFIEDGMADIERNGYVGDSTNVLGQQVTSPPLKMRTLLERNGKPDSYEGPDGMDLPTEMLEDIEYEFESSDDEELCLTEPGFKLPHSDSTFDVPDQTEEEIDKLASVVRASLAKCQQRVHQVTLEQLKKYKHFYTVRAFGDEYGADKADSISAVPDKGDSIRTVPETATSNADNASTKQTTQVSKSCMTSQVALVEAKAPQISVEKKPSVIVPDRSGGRNSSVGVKPEKHETRSKSQTQPMVDKRIPLKRRSKSTAGDKAETAVKSKVVAPAVADKKVDRYSRRNVTISDKPDKRELRSKSQNVAAHEKITAAEVVRRAKSSVRNKVETAVPVKVPEIVKPKGKKIIMRPEFKPVEKSQKAVGLRLAGQKPEPHKWVFSSSKPQRTQIGCTFRNNAAQRKDDLKGDVYRTKIHRLCSAVPCKPVSAAEQEKLDRQEMEILADRWAVLTNKAEERQKIKEKGKDKEKGSMQKELHVKKVEKEMQTLYQEEKTKPLGKSAAQQRNDNDSSKSVTLQDDVSHLTLESQAELHKQEVQKSCGQFKMKRLESQIDSDKEILEGKRRDKESLEKEILKRENLHQMQQFKLIEEEARLARLRVNRNADEGQVNAQQKMVEKLRHMYKNDDWKKQLDLYNNMLEEKKKEIKELKENIKKQDIFLRIENFKLMEVQARLDRLRSQAKLDQVEKTPSQKSQSIKEPIGRGIDAKRATSTTTQKDDDDKPETSERARLARKAVMNAKEQEKQKQSNPATEDAKQSNLVASEITAAASSGGLHGGPVNGAAGLQGPDFWMDRLNHLRAQANLVPHRKNDVSGPQQMMDNKVADENLSSFNNMNAQKAGRCDRTELSPHRLQHIQAKLALYKKESPKRSATANNNNNNNNE